MTTPDEMRAMAGKLEGDEAPYSKTEEYEMRLDAAAMLRSIAEEREADASPDLLEALQELAMIVERAFPALKHNPILLKADAAISKATGAA